MRQSLSYSLLSDMSFHKDRVQGGSARKGEEQCARGGSETLQARGGSPWDSGWTSHWVRSASKKVLGIHKAFRGSRADNSLDLVRGYGQEGGISEWWVLLRSSSLASRREGLAMYYLLWGRHKNCLKFLSFSSFSELDIFRNDLLLLIYINKLCI